MGKDPLTARVAESGAGGWGAVDTVGLKLRFRPHQRGRPWDPLRLFPDVQSRLKGAREMAGGDPARAQSTADSTPSPYSWAEPVSWPTGWPHLDFLEVPSVFLMSSSASSCSSFRPSADSTWEKRRVTVSRALACGERRGIPTLHQGHQGREGL